MFTAFYPSCKSNLAKKLQPKKAQLENWECFRVDCCRKTSMSGHFKASNFISEEICVEMPE